jgi:hypothetical protein
MSDARIARLDALDDHRGYDHEDDEHDEADVHERRDVDLAARAFLHGVPSEDDAGGLTSPGR